MTASKCPYEGSMASFKDKGTESTQLNHNTMETLTLNKKCTSSKNAIFKATTTKILTEPSNLSTPFYNCISNQTTCNMLKPI